jgi:hypothetical protein
MLSTAPLIIVAGTITSLMLISRLMAGIPASAAKAEPLPSRPRGKPLINGLSVAGLDDRGIESLLAYIKEGNAEAVTSFLAFNRPSIDELEQYLSQLRERFQQQLKMPIAELDEATFKAKAKQFDFPAAPAGMRLEVLTHAERRLLLEFDPRGPRQVNRELMARFGGNAFLAHFKLYLSHEPSITLHIPPFDADRKMFETLAGSGVASKGRHIPLEQRLSVLSMNQLRQMVKDLKLDQKFTRKADACAALAAAPGAAVLLSMQYVIDDLFMLNILDLDPKRIEREWAFLTACAKLLTSITAKATPLSDVMQEGETVSG